VNAVLNRLARLALAAPRRILAVALLVMVGAGVFGIPVVKSLAGGGFQDPNSESARAAALMADKFHRTDSEMLITLQGPEAGGPKQRAVGTDIVAQLRHSPYVAHVVSPWDAPPQVAATLTSEDGKTALIVADIVGGERDSPTYAQKLSDQVVHDRDGITVSAGGPAAIDAQITQQTEKDLLMMESIAIPLSFVVLVAVFGGLLAAGLPMAVSGLAMLGSMAALRALTHFTNVSIFALNLATAMGLALAIDYTLLILSRYRDELAGGAAPDAALVSTMTKAGRTVMFSGATVALSMLPMLAFPMYFLKSFAYAGIGVVIFAVVGALVVAPALIALFGERIGVHRRLWRKRDARAPRDVEQTFWYRWTKRVIRFAIPAGLAVTAVLLVLGLPFLGVRSGVPDDRVLPASAPARHVGEQLRTQFATDSATDVTVVLPQATDITAGQLGGYAAQLSLVPDVTWVSSPTGTFVGGHQTGPPTGTAAIADGSAYLTVASSAPLFSDASQTQLDRLHAVAAPNGVPVQLTGAAQINHDTAAAVSSRVPIVLSVVAVVAFVLLFLMTGSIVVPLKTLVLNVLSLSATFGALVWIFQDGHLGGLGSAHTGTLDLNMPVLLFCIAFGLSMDYEVFLISRTREYWLVSDRSRAANDEAVALGLARTGPVITAAAVIMSIAFAALIAAQVSFMRMFGVGLTVAVLVDATVVRMILVPAFMHLVGRANWWAPDELGRLHTRFGLSESGPTLWEPPPEPPGHRPPTAAAGARPNGARTAAT
jgi:RND superfamily putative drug exporter